MQVRASVKVITAGHDRENQAGTVQLLEGDEVSVKFDTDQVVEILGTADLIELCQN